MKDPRPFTSFALFGQHYKVRLVPTLMQEREVYGQVKNSEGEIRLQTPGGDITPEYQTITFWHEVTHAILDGISRDDLSKDEMLVDLIGRGIHQVLSSGRKPRPKTTT